jgi:hypothetical protein
VNKAVESLKILRENGSNSAEENEEIQGIIDQVEQGNLIGSANAVAEASTAVKVMIEDRCGLDVYQLVSGRISNRVVQH